VADVSIGASPPKAGPLRHIDKGGYNIGSSWGANMARGAIKETNKGIRGIHRNMSRKGGLGSLGVETSVTRKKVIDININVKSDSNVSREAASEMRKGVYDAMVDSDILAHLVTVS
jgi:hypothetical protein